MNKQSRTADKGVALQLGGWARCQQFLTVKTYIVNETIKE